MRRDQFVLPVNAELVAGSLGAGGQPSPADGVRDRGSDDQSALTMCQTSPTPSPVMSPAFLSLMKV